jgi:lipoyl(octanoyl) transferase
MAQFSYKNIDWLISESLVEYPDALNIMEQRVDCIINKGQNSLIWQLEHKDVYTAGISAKDEDLIKKTDIKIFKVNRGGKYTYHGPKMLISYLMLDLKKFFGPGKPDIALFVKFIEEWVISFLAKFNIEGFIRKERVGIWVIHNGLEKKIAAIGIKVKKWVTYHGLAINIDPNLEAFDNIVPCGISDFGVTSLKDFDINLNQDFKAILKDSFYEIIDQNYAK